MEKVRNGPQWKIRLTWDPSPDPLLPPHSLSSSSDVWKRPQSAGRLQSPGRSEGHAPQSTTGRLINMSPDFQADERSICFCVSPLSRCYSGKGSILALPLSVGDHDRGHCSPVACGCPYYESHWHSLLWNRKRTNEKLRSNSRVEWDQKLLNVWKARHKQRELTSHLQLRRPYMRSSAHIKPSSFDLGGPSASSGLSWTPMQGCE